MEQEQHRRGNNGGLLLMILLLALAFSERLASRDKDCGERIRLHRATQLWIILSSYVVSSLMGSLLHG